jgi:NadR type nicotinamide-nucleotide adenylyltransferase
MESTKMNAITRGLVIGKFAPLHKGHQYLIETALKSVDQLYVVIYNCPEVIDIPLHVRADWIRHLYPSVIVIEAWDGPKDEGHTAKIKKIQEDYLTKVVPAPITHFFSSEWYGKHVSKAFGAKNVVVDMQRKEIPISGTKVRSNPHVFSYMLHPYVYKDFVKKIVFLGAESTGKSTLTKYAAKHLNTTFMHEHGRDYWNNHKDADGKLTPLQMVELAQEHMALEQEAAMSAHKYLCVDTNAITTELFSRFYHGTAHPELKRLARLAQEKYENWFVCDTDIPYEDDGTRNGARHRKNFQKLIIKDLQARGIQFHIVSGSLEERFAQVKNVINSHSEYVRTKTRKYRGSTDGALLWGSPGASLSGLS